ncbi:rhodanese-like domain-containing protein [Planctomycetota bacterium]|nr:rhodanese-like domain-containing protein [Planctomycetota bacterium]
MNNTIINPADCYQHISESPNNCHLIDVRTPGEFEQIHATQAKLFPLDSLQPNQVLDEIKHKPGDTLYILCHSGARAQKAQSKFKSAGHENVIVVDGGTQAWDTANLPVIKSERKVISLQRQVQISAGVLITLGVILSLIHPLFIAISAFVGCGLIFAGLTNTCGMAILLAKMPWNKPKSPVKNCACSIN